MVDTVATVVIQELESWPVPRSLKNERQLQRLVAERLEEVLTTHRCGDGLQVLCEGRDRRVDLRQIAPMHVYGGSFWPDVTIVGKDATEPFAAIEVKLLTGTKPGPIATAVGQALFYRYGRPCLSGPGRWRRAVGSVYPWAVAFIVDRRRDSTLTMEHTPEEDRAFDRVLRDNKVAVVIRNERV